MNDPRSDEEGALDLRLDEARRELDELRRRLNAVDTIGAATGAASIAVLAFSVAGLFAAASNGDVAVAEYRVGYVAAGGGGALLFWAFFYSAIARVGTERIPENREDVAGSHRDDQQLPSIELRDRVLAIHLDRIVDLARLLRAKQRSLIIGTGLVTLGAFLLIGSVFSLLLAS